MNQLYKYKTGYRNKEGKFVVVDLSSKTVNGLVDGLINLQLHNSLRVMTRDEALVEVQKQTNSILSYEKPPEAKKGGLKLMQVFLAGKALVNVTRGNTVDQREVLRRSIICKNCPKITKTSDCVSCGAAKTAAIIINSIKKLFGVSLQFDSDIKLSYCGQCKCSLPLILQTKISGFKNKESDAENQTRPEQCWMRRDSKNYIP